MPENKVVFGLKNAHYSIITEAADGTFTYAAPVALEGSTELSFDAKGDTNDFYADDVLYYTTVSNQGYDGSITLAAVSREFRIDVLGETLEGTDNVLTENANSRPNKIAFMFEFDGDQKAVRHVLYNCTVTRPSIAAPRPYDGIVKRSTTTDTPDTIYDAWYTTVYNPVTV
jgi:phi13 family phage major tail protein